MSSSEQIRAAEAYIKALRTGEGSAAQRAGVHLADDVVLTLASGEVKGHDAVLAHITGEWPSTPVYKMGGWGEPREQGDQLVVDAEFPGFGAGVSKATVTFSFGGDKISAVNEAFTGWPRPEASKEIPLVARGLIDSALANGTPIVVAYVDEEGTAQLSLRGSLQVYSPTQLCAWLRSAEGGLVAALAKNPKLTMLYRDSKTRTTLVVKGVGHVSDVPAVRDRVYDISPEVEQMHDTGRKGAALLVDVTEVRGGTPKGPVLVRP